MATLWTEKFLLYSAKRSKKYVFLLEINEKLDLSKRIISAVQGMATLSVKAHEYRCTM